MPLQIKRDRYNLLLHIKNKYYNYYYHNDYNYCFMWLNVNFFFFWLYPELNTMASEKLDFREHIMFFTIMSFIK